MEEERDKKEECNNSSCCQPETNDSVSCCGSQSSGKPSIRILKSVLFFVIVLAAITMAANTIISRNNPSKKNVICGIKIEDIVSLNKIASDKDFIFIIISGEKMNRIEKVSAAINNVAGIITKNGLRVGIFTLDKDSEDSRSISKANNISIFPAVLTLGKDRGGVVIQGEITEAKLMEGYKNIMSQPTCTPGGTCCPK